MIVFEQFLHLPSCDAESRSFFNRSPEICLLAISRAVESKSRPTYGLERSEPVKFHWLRLLKKKIITLMCVCVILSCSLSILHNG